MAASKRVVFALVTIMGLLFDVMGSVDATCTVKNASSNDLLILPVSAPGVKIKVKVGAVVEIPLIYVDVIIKNLVTGKSAPLKLVDGTVLVCVNGPIKGTISVYLGALLNGIISIISTVAPIIYAL